jgi:methyl-accepting chemotaxis protein
LATTRDALDSDMKTAFANTVNAGLMGSKAQTAAVLDKVATVLTQITAAIKTSRPADLEPAGAEAISATVATLNKTLVPVLDQLLAARIHGFQSKAYRMEATAVLAMAVLAYLLVGFYRSSTRPLQRMVTALRTLAGGELTCHVEADTRDEVGEMAHGFNEALTHIRQAIQALGGNAAGIAGSSEELSRVSGRLRGAAQQTSAQADRTAEAADRVAQNVTMVASGTEEMGAAIREIAHGAAEAATVARRAVDATHASTEAVGRLGRSSVEIGDVVKVITGIAGQINLLALNASIEAARAGEAGRGFAVVANEVKELSQETAEATQVITARVHTIQDDAEAAAGAIGNIAVVIETINEIQTTIASAVEQQSATTAEMGRNVTQVATGANEIVDGVAAVSRSAEQTTTSAVTTEQAAHQLAQTATDLRAIIAQFRTDQAPNLTSH